MCSGLESGVIMFSSPFIICWFHVHRVLSNKYKASPCFILTQSQKKLFHFNIHPKISNTHSARIYTNVE